MYGQKLILPLFKNYLEAKNNLFPKLFRQKPIAVKQKLRSVS